MSIDNSYRKHDSAHVFRQETIKHPAFQDSSMITPDIYTALYDCFLQSDLFLRWLQPDCRAQLHLVGEPGSGKTTLAKVIAQQVQSLQENNSLAAIFLPDACIENDMVFLEDLLHNMYQQLTPPDCPVETCIQAAYRQYKSSQILGERAAQRVDLVTKALLFRVASLAKDGNKFLIIDHLDHCSPLLYEVVRRELKVLQNMGLKILLTSRFPQYEEPVSRWCDSPDHNDDESLTIYWQCSNCEDDICETCKKEQTYCSKCGLTSVWKDPAEYSLFVNYVPDQSLSKYVAWDLEREHGDLGLESGCTTDMPPLSALGIALKSTKYGTKIHDWIREIVRYTDGSILQTKLFLDRIHNAQSPEAVDLGPGRLPRNVQAHFDTAIRTIEQRSAHLDSTLAMKSIAAIGKDGNMFQGLNVSDLASLLQEPMYRRDPNAFLIRSMEDIIYLANGYLKLVPPLPSEQECGVATSNRLLWLYAYDDYDERIIMEYSQLRTARIPRSFSFSNSTRTDMSELKSLPLPCRRNSLGLPFVSHTSKQEQ